MHIGPISFTSIPAWVNLPGEGDGLGTSGFLLIFNSIRVIYPNKNKKSLLFSVSLLRLNEQTIFFFDI